MRAPTRPVAIALLLLAAFPAAEAAAQDLGHRLPGTLGVDAGTQPPPGIVVVDRALYYGAGSLRDRHGARIPVPGFDLDAVANAIGASATIELRSIRTYVSAAAAVPVARLRLDVADPRAGVDKYGLTDIYVQPLKLGWRPPYADVVVSYALHVPTGRFRLEGGGLSSGQLTHELSAGGALHADDRRAWRVSALASYQLNGRKEGLDLTRGDLLLIQGGAGVRLGPLDVGLAGFALWQVRDDRGADLPPVLAGARDRTFGLGPEVSLTIPALRARATLRYERELGVESRPEGQIVVLGLSYVTWRPGGESTRTGPTGEAKNPAR